MKKEKTKKNLIAMFLVAVSLIQVTCKKEDPVKIIKPEFLKCSVEGTEFQSVGTSCDSITFMSVTYKRIITIADLSGSRMIDLSFQSSLAPGTYSTTGSMGSDKFFARYIKNQSIQYFSNRGSLTLTNVTDRYEGTFNFTATQSPQDSLVVTSGSFSIKK